MDTVILETPRKPAPKHWPIRVWLASLAVLLFIGLLAMSQVLLKGLQVTDLSNQVPWGLWITLDLSMIALGAGAFTFSAAVYLFRLKQFEPLARAAVVIGFLGYTSAMIALAMDIGRPDRFWHPLVFWNVHSVLWEITWCVVLYTTVLLMELIAVAGHSRLGVRWPWLKRLGNTMHRLTPFLALIGMGLSLLHQSSLGATYSVLSGRAIWFKPSLPVMFIISAVAGGMALTLLASMIVGQIRHERYLPDSVCTKLIRTIGLITLGYLYIKIWDWASTSYYSNAPATSGILNRLNATTPYTSTFWGVEILLGGLVPAVILLLPNLCKRKGLVMLALGLVVISVPVNRWNITLSGLIAPPAWSPGVLGNTLAVSYFPSWIEVGVALGIIAYGLLGFTLAVRYLGVYPIPEEPGPAEHTAGG
jgi:molybdopterin-containing oxidoreductase family membrane subunit